jgi:hypothetical protein
METRPSRGRTIGWMARTIGICAAANWGQGQGQGQGDEGDHTLATKGKLTIFTILPVALVLIRRSRIILAPAKCKRW